MTQQVTRRRSAGKDAGYGETDRGQLPARRRSREPAADSDGDRDEQPRRKKEEPASRRRGGSGREKAGTTSGGRGWASHKANQARTRRGFGDNPDEFKVAEEDTTYLVKMLEDEPFWSYCEHFLNEIAEGKRSFTCGGDECPLCDYGDNPRTYTLFNVAAWDPDGSDGDGQWVQKFWRATPDPAGKIEARAEELGGGRNPKSLGDDDIYLAVSKSKTGKRKGGRSFNEFQVDVVKERDLEEDYDAVPLAGEDWEEFADSMFTESVVTEASLKDLRDAVEAIDD